MPKLLVSYGTIVMWGGNTMGIIVLQGVSYLS